MDFCVQVIIFLFRYVFGRPLDGRARTDATFLRGGTRGMAETGSASRWELRPGWHRAGFRIGVPGFLVFTWVVWSAVGLFVLAAGSVFVTAAVGYLGFQVFHLVRTWDHQRRHVAPLHGRLTGALGLPYKTPAEYLDVPADYRKPGTEGVRVQLPGDRHFTGEEQALLREVVTTALGMSDVDVSWHRDGARPHVSFFPAAQPPVRLTWSDVEHHIRSASPTAPFLGLGKSGVVVDADLEADSPHILLSAGTGGGKSVLTRSICAQALHHGANAIVLDFKRSSHQWAKGLSAVTYCRDIAEIHDALVALGAEAHRRNRASDDPDGEIGPRTFLVAEEMNATITKLTQYWEEIREKDDPKRSPAISGLGDVLFMGRAVQLHVLAIAQLMTARTLGGPEARENFATRCLTRYSVNAWKMLAPEVWPAPKRPKGVGLWQIVKHGEATLVRVPYLTDDEARAHALSGTASPSQVPAELAGDVRTVPGGTELVTLRDAHSELGMTIDALRRASTRPGFPAVVRVASATNLYRRGELVVWKTRRDAVSVVNRGGVA